MNYCTRWFEGWWADCCMAHDVDYAAQVGQAVADSGLFQCVAGSAPTPALAVISGAVAAVMYTGVRVFGGRFYRRAKPSDLR